MNTLTLAPQEVQEPLFVSTSVVTTNILPSKTKQSIRTSLKASTLDGVFATVFSNITGGVLLTNFLLQLGASPVEIGLLSSIPLLANFLQPLGAYLADRSSSRHWYTMTIFAPSRLLWLILVGGIAWFSWTNTEPHQLINWTLGIIIVTHILGALGGCAWFSWMAALVPQRLRGRYFGLRNSAASLTNLVCTPILGYALCAWHGSQIAGYGVLLSLGVVVGLVSLACQFWMRDVNPQETHKSELPQKEIAAVQSEKFNILKDVNFLKFLLYVGGWTFAMNLSTPFFNLYMLDNLGLDISTVTLYTSLLAGANLVMLIFWGKLADKIGNRPLLLFVGMAIALTPLFWLAAGNDSLSVWIWLPLIHIALGGFSAAIDLCNNNIQMEVAPLNRPSQYFALVAAVSGVCGGMGATAGGFLAGLDIIGGLPGLFALSAVLRLVALIPLVFVREPRSLAMIELVRNIPRFKLRPMLFPEVGIATQAK
ncbi:MFS transporter [Iningainema tapete]|uniref:MFS transporter n=1 Tax=Iningainema tapete BLCC-T55 TaxID=2748662 RepID=A0A8J6XL88_9CYAN|nr:MFS transporter [Iningainema tapete BLCC-T55]